MKNIFKIVLISSFFMSFYLPVAHAKGQKFKNALLIAPAAGSSFWDLFESVMQAAADDLDVELSIIRLKDRLAFIQEARNISKALEKPDVVFFNSSSRFDARVLKEFEDSGILVFVINSGFDDEELKTLGKPRVVYKNWIAHMAPDDEGVGFKTAQKLHDIAAAHGRQKHKMLSFGAVNGSKGSRPSDDRTRGLMRFINGDRKSELKMISFGYWREGPAALATNRIMTRYPDIDVVWAVNDETAFGVVDALDAVGRVPGKDVFVSSIDWMPETMPYIKDGRIAFSYGGHFAEGAWAMVLSYDYLNGHDFAEDLGVVIKTPMQMIDKNNVDIIGAKISAMNWDDINFKSLTKTHNPDFKLYNFNLLKLMGVESVQ